MRRAQVAGNEELFAIPRGHDRYYLYAPLRRFLAVVNGGTVAAVSKYMRGGLPVLDPAQSAVISQLQENGVLDGRVPEPPVFPQDCVFRPHEVTLFLTSRCNLRCRYCYADAGHKAIDMPWQIARAAIDLVASNAGLLGSSKFAVGFHGGGEPTVAWDQMMRCVRYARRKADRMGLDVELFAATNGLLSQSQRRYIARHFASVNVSLDGPRDIQDHNRPTVDGHGSFDAVRRTLHDFEKAGLHYGIRSTITADTAGRMTEIVEGLRSEFDFAYLHLEPVWQCGRCVTTGERSPKDRDFIANFTRAAARGRELGVAVTYSGARLGVLTSKFCAAPGDGFSVLPEGTVTSCFEITDTADPRADVFHYGGYDPASRTFKFDDERIAALRQLSVEHIPYCRDCFCKWHCAGDCLAKVFQKSGSTTHNGSQRCGLNRALTLAHLDELVAAEQVSDCAVGRGG